MYSWLYSFTNVVDHISDTCHVNKLAENDLQIFPTGIVCQCAFSVSYWSGDRKFMHQIIYGGRFGGPIWCEGVLKKGQFEVTGSWKEVSLRVYGVLEWGHFGSNNILGNTQSRSNGVLRRGQLGDNELLRNLLGTEYDAFCGISKFPKLRKIGAVSGATKCSRSSASRT